MASVPDYLVGNEADVAVPPAGRIVVHNRVIPAATLGDRGFRAWTEPVGTPNRVRCDCNWARHLPEHYRVTT